MNIYLDESVDPPQWKSYVQVQKLKGVNLWEVIDRNPKAVADYPDTEFYIDGHGYIRPVLDGHVAGEVVKGGGYSLFTRIWGGIYPPQGPEPGYMAVVGEVFDNSYEPRQRPLFQLDEGVIWPPGDPNQALMPDLFQVATALKDIYHGGAAQDHIFQIYHHPTHNETFIADIQQPRWGLTRYPDEWEKAGWKLREMYPFFRSTERLGSLMESPYAEDEEYGLRLVTALMNRRMVDAEGEEVPMLSHHESCTVFSESPYVVPRKALALVCAALMSFEWSEVLDQRQEEDGYPDPTQDELKMQKKSEREAQSVLNPIMYIAGDKTLQKAMETGGAKAYREALYRDEGEDEQPPAAATVPGARPAE